MSVGWHGHVFVAMFVVVVAKTCPPGRVGMPPNAASAGTTLFFPEAREPADDRKPGVIPTAPLGNPPIVVQDDLAQLVLRPFGHRWCSDARQLMSWVTRSGEYVFSVIRWARQGV